MANILLVNDNVQDYQIIIDACKDNTYAVTYNQWTDTYDSIFTKYENIVKHQNIASINHLALVSHGSNNPEFTFLEKENKMLISQYLPDVSKCPSCGQNKTYDNELYLTTENELFDNTFDIDKYIVDLSLNITQEELDTKETYTYEEILSIFKDVSNNVFDTSLYDVSGDESYPMPFVYYLIKNTHYAITNTSHDETFDVATTDLSVNTPDILSVNTPDIHKYIVDLSLNITQEEFNTKDIFTNEDIHSIFKDVSHNVFDMVASFIDISGSDETYPMPLIYTLIEDVYYTITNTFGNEDVLSDTSSNEYILNTLDTWSTFKEFIKKFNIQTSLDFLGCALLQSSDWKYTLETLETEQHLHLNIRASDDDTGNLKVGADWVLETDNVNIKELYFDGESIEKWYYTLNTIRIDKEGYYGRIASAYGGGVSPAGTWTVPITGMYRIEAQGGAGGSPRSTSDVNRTQGKVALIEGDFYLQANDVYKIIVGQQGHTVRDTYAYSAGGGGGGTFVVKNVPPYQLTLADALVIAGGSGGTANYQSNDSSYPVHRDAKLPTTSNVSTSGGSGQYYSSWNPGGGGGLTGNGGGTRYDGYTPTGGKSFKEYGSGGYNGYRYSTICSATPSSCTGYYQSTGGLGGGGGSGALVGGGGGGLYGGDSGHWTSGAKSGQGGGSYNNGSNQSNTLVTPVLRSTSDSIYGGTYQAFSGYVKITGPFAWPQTLAVPQIDIKFSDLYVALLNNGTVPGSYSNISFTSIRNTALVPTTGSAIPSSGPISIGSHYKGRTFEEGELYSFSSLEILPQSSTPSNRRSGLLLSEYKSCTTILPDNSVENDTSFYNVVTRGYLEWKVPKNGDYKFTVKGAQGGRSISWNDTGGEGGKVVGNVTLSKNDDIIIALGLGGTSNNYDGGGGGGTFVAKGTISSPTFLFVAGGGGGGAPSGHAGNGDEHGGNLATIGSSSNHSSGGGNGFGGGGIGNSGGGGGISTNGNGTAGGKGWANGLIGGHMSHINYNNGGGYGYGGFGGGGGGGGTYGAGGGGGYSGGAASGWSYEGGGGGSYFISSATSISQTNGGHAGSSSSHGIDGYVKIELV